MISTPLRKFLVVILSLATLFQSTGILGGFLDFKFNNTFIIQMDFEGDTDKDEEKLKIVKIISNFEESQFFFDFKGAEFLGPNNPFNLFVFEIPKPPPEFS